MPRLIDYAFPSTRGTASRTLPSRFDNIRDMSDYGVVGDSDVNATTGTDNTAKFLQAISDLADDGGGTIYVPPKGIFKVTAPLDFSANGYSIAWKGERFASMIVGNFEGYILDRDQVISGTPGLRSVEDLDIRNICQTGGAATGGIRLLGNDGGYVRSARVQALNGIVLGGDTAPPTATFTATGTGTSLVVTGISGTISNMNGGIYFPVPISGTGVPGGTTIEEYLSGGTPGGNGTYRTNNATTSSGASLQTNPNQPTCFSTRVDYCLLNGLGTYDSDPEDSFIGVGLQLGPESSMSDCSIVNFESGIRAYGNGIGIDRGRIESCTYGERLGMDLLGQSFSAGSLHQHATSHEGHYIAIEINTVSSAVIAGVQITGESGAFHNSLYGVQVNSCNELVMMAVNPSGDFSGSAWRIEQQPTELTCINCIAPSFTRGSGVIYGNIKAIRCAGFPAMSCTLAELNAIAVATDLVVGEGFLINDASSALGSQTYGAAAASGSPNALAKVWWDGTIFRYG